jgi:glycosyltransferase involved in cell wall biosynthesis
MTDKPMVSCIIIFLNGETYIAEAIESVLNQTLTDWELILVDDGSTDGATEIAKQAAAEHPDRIRYTEHPGHENRGMSASRNAGLELATGKYVAFLDADDIWLPKRLEHHTDILEQHPDVAMSMAPTLLWSSWNKNNLPSRRPWLAADIETQVGVPEMQPLLPPVAATNYLASHGAGVPGICSLTIRRDRLMEVGAFEDEFRTLYEDQVMLFKIFLNFPVIATDEILDYYRQHDGSACAQVGRVAGDNSARPRFLDWLQGYIVDMGLKDRELWKALRGEMWKFDNPKAWRFANLPNHLVDKWNVETRRAAIWLLTPTLYQRLRRLFGLNEVNLTGVGVKSSTHAQDHQV